MNLGQRIFIKEDNKQSFDSEIKEIEKIIQTIKQIEPPIPNIDLNQEFNSKFQLELKPV